jgi:hypothetical protein
MLADTDAIRAFGHAGAAQADALAGAAATLAALPVDAGALGPVAARYLAALSAAVRCDARAIGALRDGAVAAADTSGANASAYDAAQRRAATLLGTQG